MKPLTANNILSVIASGKTVLIGRRRANVLKLARLKVDGVPIWEPDGRVFGRRYKLVCGRGVGAQKP